jgi:hypothetical protein
MQQPGLLLLAIDIGDIIRLVLIFGVLAAWVIRQLMVANKPQGQARHQPAPQRPAPQQQRRGPAAAPVAGQVGPGGPAGQQADPLRDQVEEFLRRAGRQQQENPPRAAERQAQAAPREEIEVLLVGEEPPSRSRLAEPLRPLADREPTEPPQTASAPRRTRSRRRASEPLGAGVAEHVAAHVGAGANALAAQASQLGQRIIEEDAQFDVELKERFDRKLGSLAVSRPRQAEPAAVETPASQIAAMLASPDGVRQAIVLNEILRRPDDRW